MVEDELDPDLDGELELEDVVVEDEEEEELLRDGSGRGVVDIVVEEEDEVGVQDSVSEVMTPWTGRLSEDTGVPAGALTSKVYVWPPATVTLTVHASADALGTTDRPSAMSAAASSPSNSGPLRLISKSCPSPSEHGCGQP